MSHPPRRSRRAPYGRYQPTPFGDLKVTSAFWLLNVVVTNVEAHEQTNGAFDFETSELMAAWTRRLYDFPDLDRDAGTGVALSVMPFLINPDDYLHERVGQRHAQAIVDALQDRETRMPFDPAELRYEGTPDYLAEARAEGKPTWYYKQRFISFVFAGPPHELDRLWEAPPEPWVPTLMDVLWEGAEFVEGVFIEPGPRLEFMKQAGRVSRENVEMWLDVQADIAQSGGLELTGFQRQPGSWPALVYRATEETGANTEDRKHTR